MKFPQNLLEEIRERIPVSDVVGRKVKLRRQGREYAGLSPFNKEKTPSFFVNDQKQFYHCFSSGKHGDIFKFLMETEGLSFPEAVKRWPNRLGLLCLRLTRKCKSGSGSGQAFMMLWKWLQNISSFSSALIWGAKLADMCRGVA
jgi:DNA primase catalytic core